jgi:hypothetical protein
MKAKIVFILLTLALLTACGAPADSPTVTATAVEPTVTPIPMPQAFADLVSAHPEFKTECNTDLCNLRYVHADNAPEVTISTAAQTDNQWKYSITVNGQEITYDQASLQVATKQDEVEAVVVKDELGGIYVLDAAHQKVDWKPLPPTGTVVNPNGVERWNADTNEFVTMTLPEGVSVEGASLSDDGAQLTTKDGKILESIGDEWFYTKWQDALTVFDNNPAVDDFLAGMMSPNSERHIVVRGSSGNVIKDVSMMGVATQGDLEPGVGFIRPLTLRSYQVAFDKDLVPQIRDGKLIWCLVGRTGEYIDRKLNLIESSIPVAVTDGDKFTLINGLGYGNTGGLRAPVHSIEEIQKFLDDLSDENGLVSAILNTSNIAFNSNDSKDVPVKELFIKWTVDAADGVWLAKEDVDSGLVRWFFTQLELEGGFDKPVEDFHLSDGNELFPDISFPFNVMIQERVE